MVQTCKSHSGCYAKPSSLTTRLLSRIKEEKGDARAEEVVADLQEEINKRVAVFFGGAVLAGAFGGIFGYALSRMAGVGGLNGWQWIVSNSPDSPSMAC